MRHEFDIAAFDPHPAFRIKRGRWRDRPVRSLPIRNANVWPLPSIGGDLPRADHTRDGVSFSYEPSPAMRLPSFVPVFAVSDAVIEYAGKAHDTHTIVLDHGDGHRSVYAGLAHMFVMPTTTHRLPQRVKAGDVLGYLGPATQAVCVLRFSLLKRDAAGHFSSIDPAGALESWAVLPWADDRTSPPAVQPLAA